jgi:ribonuclease J
MWRGYLADGDGAKVKAWFDAGGTPGRHIHTSGHASPDDLRAFAAAVKARRLVPVHGSAWDRTHEHFPPITRLCDGEALLL